LSIPFIHSSFIHHMDENRSVVYILHQSHGWKWFSFGWTSIYIILDSTIVPCHSSHGWKGCTWMNTCLYHMSYGWKCVIIDE
jgi:hypothetical protein